MVTDFDYVIVGSGLTGATIARELVDAGKRVVVLEKRGEVGGNIHDYKHFSGVVVHQYGPHYFRTNDDDLWSFVNRFGDFYSYRPVLKSLVDGRYENWPILSSYIKKTIGEDWKPNFVGAPGNFEEAALALMPKAIYEKFVKGYTEKQWGVEATSLNASLIKRFDVRLDNEATLMRHRHQGIPVLGYTKLIQTMLSGIPVVINFDYLKERNVFSARFKVVYTGQIDAYFSYQFGKLKYRGQNRETNFFPDSDWVQPVGQVNNPDPHLGPHIRSIEWKHIMMPTLAERIRGTVVTKEVPVTPTDSDNCEYPFPDRENDNLYSSYRELADNTPKLLVCGRLGEYKYYDMDQAIARARLMARRELSGMKQLS